MKDQQVSSLPVQKPTSFLKAIILTGLTVGVLDITAAFTHAFIANGVTPIRVLHFIASKAFGKDAFSGGLPMAFMGLIFHFIIAFSWTLFFFWLYPKVNFLSKNKIIAGIGYGLFVWLMMNMVVLPVVNGAFGSFSAASLIGIAIHMVCVGLPISLGAQRYYAAGNNNS